MKPIDPCLWLACVLSFAGSQVSTNSIQPGKQLGKLKVGDLMDDMKWLKKPDYGDASSDRQWQTWEAKKPDPRNGKIINSLDVYSSLNADGKFQIRVIRSTSPTFATTEKIKVGSYFDEVKEKYPKIEKVGEYESPQFSAKVALYDDTAHGVAFEFKVSKDGAVAHHALCLAVWVHEPRVDLLHQYADPVQYLSAKPAFRSAAKHRGD